MSQRKGYGVVQTGASEWSDGFPCFSTCPCKVVSWKGEKIKDKAGTSRRDDLAPHDGPLSGHSWLGLSGIHQISPPKSRSSNFLPASDL